MTVYKMTYFLFPWLMIYRKELEKDEIPNIPPVKPLLDRFMNNLNIRFSPSCNGFSGRIDEKLVCLKKDISTSLIIKKPIRFLGIPVIYRGLEIREYVHCTIDVDIFQCYEEMRKKHIKNSRIRNGKMFKELLG